MTDIGPLLEGSRVRSRTGRSAYSDVRVPCWRRSSVSGAGQQEGFCYRPKISETRRYPGLGLAVRDARRT